MVRLKAMVFAVGIVFLLLANAEEPASSSPEQAALEAKMCSETKCQRNLRVTLRQKDGKSYDQTFKVFPGIVQGIGLTIVAGQTIYVEAEVSGHRLINFTAVDTIKKPEKTITAKLEQMDHGGMMLQVTNPFQKSLKFNMGVMPLNSNGLHKTSSCPIIPGGSAYEMWPYPIFQLVLSNAHLLGPKDEIACEK